MEWSRNCETPAKLIHTVMGHGVMPDANNVKFQRNYPSPSTHVRCALGGDGQVETAGEKSERWCALIARAAQLCSVIDCTVAATVPNTVRSRRRRRQCTD